MVWLIGSGGMLGSDVEILLKEYGGEYVASDLEIDITDIDCLKKFVNEKQIEWIINCAAYTAVDKAEEEPEKAFRLNADGALNIAQIALDKGARLIHISTDYVFDGEKQGPYTEDDIPCPVGIYGKSKLQGEENIRKTLKEYFIIRTAWLYGKNGNNFVNTMLRLFKERENVKVVSDQWGSPTYTKDIAGAVINIVKSKSDKYGIYHFTNEGKTNWHEFAKSIHEKAKNYELIQKDIDIISITSAEYPAKAKRPKNSLLSKDKINLAFGVKIRNWQDALEDFIKDISGLWRRIKKWEEYSALDIDTAYDIYNSGRYIYVLFFCQQSIEKYIKSLVEYYEIPKRTHNLIRLLNAAHIDDYKKYEYFLIQLNMYYLESRYANDIDKIIGNAIQRKASDFLKLSKEVLSWLKQKKKPFLF